MSLQIFVGHIKNKLENGCPIQSFCPHPKQQELIQKKHVNMLPQQVSAVPSNDFGPVKKMQRKKERGFLSSFPWLKNNPKQQVKGLPFQIF